MNTTESGDEGGDGVCGKSVAMERTLTRAGLPSIWNCSEWALEITGLLPGIETTRLDDSCFAEYLDTVSGSETILAEGTLRVCVPGAAGRRYTTCGRLRVRVTVWIVAGVLSPSTASSPDSGLVGVGGLV